MLRDIAGLVSVSGSGTIRALCPFEIAEKWLQSSRVVEEKYSTDLYSSRLVYTALDAPFHKFLPSELVTIQSIPVDCICSGKSLFTSHS